MSVTVKAIVGATTYTISGGNPFYYVGMVGLGIAPTRRLKDRGPLQDGATDIGYRLDERLLNLVLLVVGSTPADMDTQRDTLKVILRPRSSTPVKLNITRDDGAIRQIDTYAVGLTDYSDTIPARLYDSQLVAIQLEAANPIWYNPALVNLTFETVVGGTEGFQIPMLVPWDQLPGDIIDATQTVAYAGDYKEYPVIVVTGPADDITITNVTTGEVLDFTNANIPAGDSWTIDLRYGYKDIINEAGASQLSALSAASNLGTWHLEPGDNDITISIPTGATTATSVSIRYYNRYVGL